MSPTIIAQFVDQTDSPLGGLINLPVDMGPEHLNMLINELLQNEDPMPYSFLVEEQELVNDIDADVLTKLNKSREEVIKIVYLPQAIFKVRAVTRCSSSMQDHTDAVLSVAFSPDGKKLASGSGDCSVRFWDLNTETPKITGTTHKNWVMCISWCPNGKQLASGSMDNTVQIWDGASGQIKGNPLRGHSKCVTSLSWEPMHRNAECFRLASSSKDGTVRIWDTRTGRCSIVLSQHTQPVMSVVWGGEGWIYTGSRDRTIKVWDDSTGSCVRTLKGHGHWVNTLALNNSFVLRTACFDHTDPVFNDTKSAHEAAKKRYNEAMEDLKDEILVSGSDDFSMFLWIPKKSESPIARLTGHQQAVNHVSFSPDGRLIASASFDKTVKLWNGSTGKFLTNLRNHVGAVYQVCWSSDSRMLLSASKDSTMKIWDLKKKKLMLDLPGHLDEVYTVDWSPSGDRVASGGKDKVLKIWRQ